MYQIMELKDINENYKNSQSRIAKLGPAKAKVDALKQEIKPLTRAIEDLLIKRNRAVEDKDDFTKKQAEKEIADFKAKLEAKKASLGKIQNAIFKTESELDKQFESIKQLEHDNPEFLEHMNTVIGKKFSRKAQALGKEKKELSSKNEQLTIIKNAASKDSYVMNTLKGIEGYTQAIDSYTKAIEQLSASKDPNDLFKLDESKNKLSEAEKKLTDRRNDLKSYFKGSISDDVINSLTGFSNINKDIKSNNRQIKGIEKSIANYRTALKEIGYTLDDVPTHPISFDSKGNAYVDIYSSSDKDPNKNPKKSQLPAVKPKWYQFIKRFKNWRNSKKIDVEPKESQEPKIDDESNKFKDSMKYDVVRDYAEKIENDLLKNAKAKNKESKQDEQTR